MYSWKPRLKRTLGCEIRAERQTSLLNSCGRLFVTNRFARKNTKNNLSSFVRAIIVWLFKRRRSDDRDSGDGNKTSVTKEARSVSRRSLAIHSRSYRDVSVKERESN